ncbi:hypothetical protein [Pseudoduganella violaceinigra]|uniref:hypothetical protein n=1 Tax=Pseudoduganella violaceinigra TaxID=246602 RepID=UPI00040BFCC4|nr:hypothetical protein [Pseudoduganella violaceinigra]
MSTALLLALALDLTAAPPVEYDREGGTGTLTITQGSNGEKKFTLSTFGPNAHDCELSGSIKGTIGTLDDQGPGEPECRIAFAQKGSVVEVTPQSMEACAGVCGARATFHGRYYVAPRACKPAASKATKDAFLVQYKAKNYQQAYDTLNGWLGQCSHLMHWMEADQVRNDLAMTQFHLKQPAACLATLAKNYAAKMKTIKALEEELPPMDYEAYVKTAKATFFNQKLCSQ